MDGKVTGIGGNGIMKKVLSIILAVCLIGSLLVMPVSAGTLMEKDITPVASGITSNDIAANAANVGSNVVDGDADTMAIVDGYGRGVYVDLGAEYDLTSLDIVLPSADEITSFVSENEIALAEAVSAVNTGAHIRVGGESYGSYLTGNATINGGTRLNIASQNIGKGKTVTYTNLSAVRYIVVTPTASSTPIAVTDIKVRGMVEVGGTQTVNKQITPVGVSCVNNPLENTTTNKADNVIDGKESTMTLVDNSGAYLYVDLGAEYDITRLEVVLPNSTDVTDFITANNFDTNEASKYNTACQIWASNTINARTVRVNADSQNIGLGKTKTYTDANTWTGGIYGTDKYRYITFYAGGYDYPVAISEVRVYGMVTEEVVCEAEIVNIGAQYGVESDGNLATNATITGEYKNSGSNYPAYDRSYLIDNDPSTVALIGGRVQFSTGNSTAAIIILDLGAPRYLTNVKLDPIAESEESDFVAGLDVTNISNAANVNDGVHIYLSNTLPTYDNPGEQLSTSQIASAENSNYTLDGTVAYRYVAIKSLAGSYPGAFSGITIKDTAEIPEKLRFFFVGVHNIPEPSSFGAYIVPFALLGSDEEAATSPDSVMVENTTDAALLTSGSTFAVDLKGIEADYYDTSILALPFVSLDGEYYFGTAATTTVNEVLAAQAQ